MHAEERLVMIEGGHLREGRMRSGPEDEFACSLRKQH